MTERYVGIDINEKYAIVSYYAEGMPEPGTFSMVAGGDAYQVPLCLYKKKESGQWFYGEEAKRRAKEDEEPFMDCLLGRALRFQSVEMWGDVHDAARLLFQFIKRLIGFAPAPKEEPIPMRLAIASETMNLEMRKLFGLFMEWMGLPAERLLLFDYRECFYYYALSQPKELFGYDVMLYYYTVGKLLCWRLTRDRKTDPQVASIEESHYEALLKDPDAEFAKIAKASLAGFPVSAAYLIGDGFDGEWMRASLDVICQGRRAFMGKNLFSKGACYGAAVKAGQAQWPFVYLGDNELRVNVGVKVWDQGEEDMFPLIVAGENWYEAGGECEVILSGSPSVDLWFWPPMERKPLVRPIALSGLTEREEKTTRLRILAKPLSADSIRFCVMDLGFGEIRRSTEKTWEYTIAVSAVLGEG